MEFGTIFSKKPNGFGFIKIDNGMTIYFNADDLRGGLHFELLAVGQRVAFERSEGTKGPRAVNVQPRKVVTSGH